MNVWDDFYPKKGMSMDYWFFVGSAETPKHSYGFLLRLMVMTGADDQQMMKMAYSVTKHRTGSTRQQIQPFLLTVKIKLLSLTAIP